MHAVCWLSMQDRPLQGAGGAVVLHCTNTCTLMLLHMHLLQVVLLIWQVLQTLGLPCPCRWTEASSDKAISSMVIC